MRNLVLPSSTVWLLALGCFSSEAAAHDEVLVVLPSITDELSRDKNTRLGTSLRKTAIQMADELEMDVLDDRETTRALKRWGPKDGCQVLACQLDVARDLGADYALASVVERSKGGGMLELEIELYELTRASKRRGAKRGRKMRKKPKLLEDGKTRMRTFRRLREQGRAGVDKVLSAAFLEEMDEELDDKRPARLRLGRRSGRVASECWRAQDPACDRRLRGQRPMHRTAFEGLLDELGRGFDENRLKIVKAACQRQVLTAGQARAVLKKFSFDEGRLDALRFLAPRIVDPEHASEVGKAMSHSSSREAAVQLVYEQG